MSAIIITLGVLLLPIQGQILQHLGLSFVDSVSIRQGNNPAETLGGPTEPAAVPNWVPAVEMPSSKSNPTPKGEPTSKPKPSPKGEPTSKPKPSPKGEPTSNPKAFPHGKPTMMPKGEPTSKPTAFPHGKPTMMPKGEPTQTPYVWSQAWQSRFLKG